MIYKLIKQLFLTAFILHTCFLFTTAQTIHGKITDSLSKEPIIFANIYFKSGMGTASNKNGSFSLTVPAKGNDTLFITCIGYTTQYYLPAQWKNFQNKIIALAPAIETKTDVHVYAKKITAYEIVQKAMENIPQNCINGKHYYQALYNEQITDYDPREKYHTRTVNAQILIENDAFKKLHPVGFFPSLKENIYMLALSKHINDSIYTIKKGIAKTPNYLKYLLCNNAIRYKQYFINSPKRYNYTVEKYFYDSTLHCNLLSIKIESKDTSVFHTTTEMLLSSDDYKIFKISCMQICTQAPKIEQDGTYYKMYDTYSLVEYKQNKDGKMELVYLWEKDTESGYFYAKNHQHHVTSFYENELRVLGVVKNANEFIDKLPLMDMETNVYDQKINGGKSFKLSYPIQLE